ncbi:MULTISPECIES: hypothetical protein [Nocardia]|uniref:hypothetical protein n=1 Tax=Nocardia TaxID=1817 RepID=UPI001F0DF900
MIVSGRLKQRSWQTAEGDKRSRVELEVEEIGPSLRYATAKVNRVSRPAGVGGDGNGYSRSAAGRSDSDDRARDLVGAAAGAGSDNPWAFNGAGSFGGGSVEDPAF